MLENSIFIQFKNLLSRHLSSSVIILEAKNSVLKICACSHRDGEVGADVTRQETYDKQESRLSAILEVPVNSLAAHEHGLLHTMRPEIETQ
jgi:hypothetical protein